MNIREWDWEVDPTPELFSMLHKWLMQKWPHVRAPEEFAQVASYDPSSQTSQVQKAGDKGANGYSYPHLVPYGQPVYAAGVLTGYTTPGAGDIIVVANLPSGPYIRGKLSA